MGQAGPSHYHPQSPSPASPVLLSFHTRPPRINQDQTELGEKGNRKVISKNQWSGSTEAHPRKED